MAGGKPADGPVLGRFLHFTCAWEGAGVHLGGLPYCRSVVIEVDGNRWKLVPGGNATAEEFIAARSLISQIHQQALWSPWVMQDRAAEYDAALAMCGQWASADPAARKTLRELEAEMEQREAGAGARLPAEQAQAGKDRAGRARHYDPGREQARLALLEQQAILAGKLREREEIRAGGLFPRVDDGDRRQLLDGLEHAITARTREVDDLAVAVGDPETVPDVRGWLPAERRDVALALFKARRGNQVRELRSRIASTQATLRSQKGMTDRVQLREALRTDKARLAYWEDMPPLDASGMCSECASPAWHAPGTTYSIDGFHVSGGPCPAWPQWAGRVDAVREALLQPAQGPPEPPPPGRSRCSAPACPSKT
jgi:hypothetical protein